MEWFTTRILSEKLCDYLKTMLDQRTIYRNAQPRYMHIMYCTLWEECKQKQKLKIFGFLVNIENTIAIYSYATPWALSLKNDALPLNSLFWSLPTAAHRFDAWAVVVYIFLVLDGSRCCMYPILLMTGWVWVQYKCLWLLLFTVDRFSQLFVWQIYLRKTGNSFGGKIHRTNLRWRIF